MLNSLTNDRRGFATAISAIMFLPITAIAIAGAEIGIQTSRSSEVASIAGTACERINSSVFSVAAPADRQAAAQAVLDRMIADAGLDTSAGQAHAVIKSYGIQVDIDGSFPGITHAIDDAAVQVTLDCDPNPANPNIAPPRPAGRLMFAEGFEQPRVSTSGYSRWFIEPNLDNWDLVSGAGVQINDNNLTTDLQAFEGSQFVELAGDRTRGALPGRTRYSVISRTVHLNPGRYQLSYYYHENDRDLTPDHQVINVFLDPDDGTALMTNNVMTKNQSTGWEQQIHEFDVRDALAYRITFQPEGLFQDFGAYVDNIQLVKIQ